MQRRKHKPEPERFEINTKYLDWKSADAKRNNTTQEQQTKNDSIWQGVKRLLGLIALLLIVGTIQAQTRYEAEAMQVVAAPEVDPIPVLPTVNSMYFYSWGTIAFKPVESGTCQIVLRIREDHAGTECANVAVNDKSFEVIDTNYYLHTDTISIIDSVWISFTNDFPNERNIEIDYVELVTISNVPDTGKVVVSWLPNSEPDLAGYIVYYGFKSKEYKVAYPVGLDTFKFLSRLPFNNLIYFAVTAYDTVPNESDFSDEVSITLISEPAFHYRKGDWNQDRKINLTDLIEFDIAYGALIGGVFDFNDDLKINLTDLIAFDTGFGLIY